MKRIEKINKLIDSESSMDNHYLVNNNDVRFLLNVIESQKEEIEKLREIQRVLVITTMQRMSKVMESIEKFNTMGM